MFFLFFRSEPQPLYALLSHHKEFIFRDARGQITHPTCKSFHHLFKKTPMDGEPGREEFSFLCAFDIARAKTRAHRRCRCEAPERTKKTRVFAKMIRIRSVCNSILCDYRFMLKDKRAATLGNRMHKGLADTLM